MFGLRKYVIFMLINLYNIIKHLKKNLKTLYIEIYDLTYLNIIIFKIFNTLIFF